MWRRAVDELGRLTSWAVGRDQVFALIQQGLLSSLQARILFERGVTRILAMANLPSRRDLDRIQDRLHTVDDQVAELQARIDALLAELVVAQNTHRVVQPPAKPDE